MINRLIGGKAYRRDYRATLSIIFILITLTVLTLPCSACSDAMNTQNTPVWVASHIYCGRNIPAGGEVSEQQFSEFLETQVTPSFPAGLTCYDAYGQMQDSHQQIVKQKTKVLILVHENSKADTDAVKQIILSYRSTFGNPQVMLNTVAVTPGFYGN
jgi:hypothetical protein